MENGRFTPIEVTKIRKVESVRPYASVDIVIEHHLRLPKAQRSLTHREREARKDNIASGNPHPRSLTEGIKHLDNIQEELGQMPSGENIIWSGEIVAQTAEGEHLK